MSLTRQELIADWRCRLTDAEAQPADDSPRGTWLARIRARLYRFLLTIYGDAQWTADQSERQTPGDSQPIFVAPAELPLAGKPARSRELIRGVLQSVSKAQDATPTAGPLAAGLTKNSWVVAALYSHVREVDRCQALLRRYCIESRVIPVGRKSAIEVRAADRAIAFASLAQLEPYRRPQARVIERRLQSQSQISRYLVMALIVLLMCWLTAVLILNFT